MSDHYGIGAAIRGALGILYTAGRGERRTTSLVEDLNDGDRVIFTNEREAERVRKLALERGVAVEVRVCDPRRFDFPHPFGTAQGRTIFDHTWVEEYYQSAIDRAWTDIEKMQADMTGYDQRHRDTARKARETQKWANSFPQPPTQGDR